MMPGFAWLRPLRQQQCEWGHLDLVEISEALLRSSTDAEDPPRSASVLTDPAALMVQAPFQN